MLSLSHLALSTSRGLRAELVSGSARPVSAYVAYRHSRPVAGSVLSGGAASTCRLALARSYAVGPFPRMPNQKKSASTMLYLTAMLVTTVTVSYASAPLYKAFCQATGYGGTTKHVKQTALDQLKPVKDRRVTVRFNADVSRSMQWKFRPQQKEVVVVPGETALAFYTATNPTDKPVIGVSTYNVIPFEAGQYFNKIQCFCFEEQRLNPHEQVDMPVFFFIDPEFAEDPLLFDVDTITLSYTFFESRSHELTQPQHSQQTQTPPTPTPISVSQPAAA